MVRKILYMSLTAFLQTLFFSCSDDDDNPPNVVGTAYVTVNSITQNPIDYQLE